MSGDEGMEIGRGLRIASPPELAGDTHALCHLKKEGDCLGMSPFLPSSRKNDSLCFELAFQGDV